MSQVTNPPASVEDPAPWSESAVPGRYRHDWQLFLDWCAATDNVALPTDPDTVIAFLDAHPATRATHRRRLTAIRWIHHHAGRHAPHPTMELRSRTRKGMWWRRSREQSVGLLLIALILAVGGVVVSRGKGPGWLLFLLAATIALGAVLLPWLRNRAKRKDTQGRLLENAVRVIDPRGDLPQVSKLELSHFGVHRAHVELAYLHRDKEAELVQHLVAGRPVVVVGHSMSGKTRMAAHLLSGLARKFVGGQAARGSADWWSSSLVMSSFRSVVVNFHLNGW
ncbi:MAG TPA: hypothetical protein VIU87_23375, partial [Mycobacterium sp.]